MWIFLKEVDTYQGFFKFEQELSPNLKNAAAHGPLDQQLSILMASCGLTMGRAMEKLTQPVLFLFFLITLALIEDERLKVYRRQLKNSENRKEYQEYGKKNHQIEMGKLHM